MIRPATPAAYQLLHHGVLALAAIEHNGIRINLNTINKRREDIKEKIRDIEERLRGSKIFKEWQRSFGSKMNINSRAQLAHVLFNKLGYEAANKTAKGLPSTEAEDLERLGIGFVTGYIKQAKLKKVLSTYIEDWTVETGADGIMHPSFNLHLTETYRSQCEDPNLQNVPIRDAYIGPLIRSCVEAHDENSYFTELDFSGVEVKVSCANHKDPTMMRYLTERNAQGQLVGDMHKDMAAQIFMLPKETMPKEIRQTAKNKFVFPSFYGSYYHTMAIDLWNDCVKYKHKTTDGVDLIEHLKSKGIRELGSKDKDVKPVKGTFIYHLQQIEQDYWGRRFATYDRWKKRIWEQYLRDGGISTLTGFCIHGVFRRNQIINTGTQGPAFHCNLQSIIWIQEEIRKRKMKTKLVGQVHDSILASVPKNEFDDFAPMAKKIMTKRLCETWTWINVPMEIEVDRAPLGGSWADKKKIEVA